MLLVQQVPLVHKGYKVIQAVLQEPQELVGQLAQLGHKGSRVQKDSLVPQAHKVQLERLDLLVL